ncbi:hypothetical protein EDWATA_02456 [Edwardsiella tarda ATCC 23685]|uniref:Uncharacterized protein n=1 Tax=Edwardsiella tarda ATCC 23685 TaxID=500638 RepID=D4F6S2_EDWTA|nr:hypothetical protein EDWATA_02456 [Edwardsiella tarda ATCC 23685]
MRVFSTACHVDFQGGHIPARYFRLIYNCIILFMLPSSCHAILRTCLIFGVSRLTESATSLVTGMATSRSSFSLRHPFVVN